MHTLVDFITHVKGIEYIISLLAIGGFLLLWEALKPAPFRTVVAATREDLGHLRNEIGYREALRNVGKIAAAPFIGLAYVVFLPIGFIAALAYEATNGLLKAASGALRLIGKEVSFEWRPLEAYFTGKKKSKSAGEKK